MGAITRRGGTSIRGLAVEATAVAGGGDDDGVTLVVSEGEGEGNGDNNCELGSSNS